MSIPRSSTRRLAVWVMSFFFLSGLTGLIYEILWTRMLVKLIGGAPFAVSIILTVFMGGLGLGSYLAGRVIDRIDRPIRLVQIYGILELLIGAYALAIPFLLAAFKPLFAELYNRLFAHFMLYNLLTFLGCSVLLCIPVICMGATLPVLCRFYVTDLPHLGTHVGRLYGLNTIGAASGSLLCGFWLLSRYGMNGALAAAVVINFIIGLSCLLAGARRKERKGADYRGAPDTKPALPGDSRSRDPALQRMPWAVKGVLVIFGISGFCAMAYEVIWTRLLGLLVGPTTYSFTIVLFTFILGLGLGSLIFGRLSDRTGRAVGLLISTQIAAALFALAASQLMGNGQLFFAKLVYTFGEGFAALCISKGIALFALMILPTLCLGAAFPLVGKIYTQSVSSVGRSIGFAYMINTLGAVSGSFCAGFVMIPLLGKERGLSLVVGLQLFTALAMAGVLGRPRGWRLWKWIPAAVPALAGIALCLHFPGWNRSLLAKGRYHRFEKIRAEIEGTGWWEALIRGSRILDPSREGGLLYYGDGVGGFTTVIEYTNAIGDVEYSMLNSGKPEASSRADMMTQTLLSHFPMLFHPDPRRVMVLGLASGVTAGEVLCYPVERLDVVDINPQVVEASAFFKPWNNDVLADPRTNLILQDGLAHLQLTKERYDVIISEPSNPWMAGLANLFTLDFFEQAGDRLNPGGLFVQFMHAYQNDWPSFAMVGRTFAEVFPQSLLLSTAPDRVMGDYLLIGFNGKDRLSLEIAGRKLAHARRSKNINLADPRLLYRLIISEDLHGLFGEGPVNTLGWPLLEFAAPKRMFSNDQSIEDFLKSRSRITPETMEVIREVNRDVDAQIDFAAYALSLHRPFRNMVDLSGATPEQKERYFDMMEAYCADNPIDLSLFSNYALVQRCCAAQIECLLGRWEVVPDKALSHFNLAKLYHLNGRFDEAVDHYERSLDLEPDSIEPMGQLAWLLAVSDESAYFDPEEAVRLAERACELTGYGRSDMLDTLAAAYAAGGRYSEAVDAAEKALKLARSSRANLPIRDMRHRLGLYKAGRPFRMDGDS